MFCEFLAAGTIHGRYAAQARAMRLRWESIGEGWRASNMCGITGLVGFSSDGRDGDAIIEKMTESLTHRGPDSAGCYSDGIVRLGFRRLSIIDHQTGNQPIRNEDGSIILICNGEIYNHSELRRNLEQKGHSFGTNSDVEVLIHLYEEHGEDLLREVDGQFAFAIYDIGRRHVFLARDHFGVNPLFYTVTGGVFVFASEIKAILQHPGIRPEVNLTGLDQVLTLPGLVSPHTLFRGIHSLPSGHSIRVHPTGYDVREYWDLNYPAASEIIDKQPEDYYRDGVRRLFERSVKNRLQADVEVGCYLSGGLDSSYTAATFARLNPGKSMESFGIVFDDGNIDEGRYQRMLAESAGLHHHEIPFQLAGIRDRIYQMVRHCECPVRELYNTCSLDLSRAAKDNGISVILTGEGADEIFGGYYGYRFDDAAAGRIARRGDDLDEILEADLRDALWGDRSLFYEKNFYALREIKQALYAPSLKEAFRDFDCTNTPFVNKERLRGRHVFHQRSYLDFKLRLADHLVSDHGDRMAMANSVEARYPFLDLQLIEFVKSIPPRFHIADSVEKRLLKRAADGVVPSAIVNRQKFGFQAPGTPLLLQQDLEWAHDLLSYDRIRRQGYFDPDVVERLKQRNSRPSYRLNPILDDDYLMVVLTFNILIDIFNLPSLN